MTLDSEAHREFLLEVLTSEKLTVPATVVDLYVEVREAVRCATVAVEDATFGSRIGAYEVGGGP